MKKSVLVMFHLMFWIFTGLLITLGFQLLSLPAIIFGGGDDLIIENLTALLVALPAGAVIFYASYFSFNFFLKKPVRFLWIALFYAILKIGLIIEGRYGISTGLSSEPQRIDFLSVLIVLIPILYFNTFGFLFRTFIEWLDDRKIKAELQRDKVESQLELLKSKLNPHFLFNTLNNIDILILDDPEKASMYLRKLSEILRFMLFDTSTEFIPLAKEIEYIRKYMDLQKIRTSNPDFADLQVEGDPDNRYIAPMIFVHFIENAFKHATNKKIKNAISVRFIISGKSVSFMCTNHIQPAVAETGEKSGTGMKLIRQRLDLIYKKGYILRTEETDNWYIVNLEIATTDAKLHNHRG